MTWLIKAIVIVNMVIWPPTFVWMAWCMRDYVSDEEFEAKNAD